MFERPPLCNFRFQDVLPPAACCLPPATRLPPVRRLPAARCPLAALPTRAARCAARRVRRDRGCSYPWDTMHLFFENVIPNLVKFWSAFARTLAGGLEKFTAESWCFWFVYLAPDLLKGLFRDRKYHIHACALGDIIKVCLQFTITYAEINALEQKIIQWVQTYEQRHPKLRSFLDHLDLLHGRYCGFLKRGLRSKVSPWASLNRRALHYAYLEHIGVRYDLPEELAIFGQQREALSQGEKKYEAYPYAVLQVPYQKSNTPDDDLRGQIAQYFADVLGEGATKNKVFRVLPQIMPPWGKVRIVGGDSLRAAWRESVEDKRDNTWVRPCQFVKQMKVLKEKTKSGNKRRSDSSENEYEWVPQLEYGRFEQILECSNIRGSGNVTGRHCVRHRRPMAAHSLSSGIHWQSILTWSATGDQ
ncbi:hypothetical protein GGX14DRAFT_397543 [Mycena pura]|uniref:Uncharacterized protein n=1 Tax=Mycena pura TaxID=153505 RepID=A0AAD6VBT7_9AGAR|nr:hypothetical protein GGX14DRAFT_397543 [Mycena pura]